ncbi:beta strand repeat-containing protein [Acinetobacter indicus]|uniref:beta strand repeat-containing protein n=1 Tax=Acinetobacter indicus TaxID=756892 RepID=UPI000CEC4655|nr:VCBS domain-containing protein [Acinetobacter indicus]
MKNQFVTVKLHDAKKVISIVQVSKGPDQPVVIQAQKKVNYEFVDEATQFAPENIKTKRVGNNLHVAFEDDKSQAFDTDLIIENYYNNDGSTTNLLIGQHENGGYYAYVPESGLQEHAVSLLAEEIAAGQALGGEQLIAAYTFNPYWLLALIPLAGLAAAGGGSSSSNGGGVVEDTIAPAAPTVVAEDDGSVTITPPTDADVKTVEVTYTPEGSDTPVISTVTKGDDGKWSSKDANLEVNPDTGEITIPEEKVKDGTDVTADATDDSGNVGPSDTDTAKDVTSPSRPAVTIQDGGDGQLSKAEVEAGVQVKIDLPADAKPGDTLNVDTDGDGTPDVTKVLTQDDITNGVTITVPAEDVPTSGQLTVDATVADAAGNESQKGTGESNIVPSTDSVVDTVTPVNGSDTATEGETAAPGTAVFNVGLNGVPAVNTEVTVTVAPDTAHADQIEPEDITMVQYSTDGGATWTDLAATGGTFTVPAGTDPANVLVQVLAATDGMVEPVEGFVLSAAVGTQTAVTSAGTVVDATASVVDTVTPVNGSDTATEGETAAPGTAVFNVGLNGVPAVNTEVTVTVAPDTAHADQIEPEDITMVQYSTDGGATWTDLAATGGTFTVPAGTDPANVLVQVLAATDGMVEPVEGFVLSAAVGTQTAVTSAGTVVDATASVVADNGVIMLSNGAEKLDTETQSSVVYQVNLNKPLADATTEMTLSVPTTGAAGEATLADLTGEVAVSFLDVNGDLVGTATTAMIDPMTGKFTVTLPQGASSVQLSLAVHDDTGVEMSETLTLSASVGTQTPVTGDASIADNDLAFTTPENQTNVTILTIPEATYAITGGVDAALFHIDQTTGKLTFENAPDFENPTDDGNDNVYNLQVTITYADGSSEVKDIAVTVTDDLNSIPDTATLNMGQQSVIVHESTTYSNFQVLGVAENLGQPGPGQAPLVQIDDGIDGIITESDVDASNQVHAKITLPSGTQLGDTLVVTYPNGTTEDIVLTQDDINVGYVNVGFIPLAEGVLNVLNAVVKYVDGSYSPVGRDTATTDWVTVGEGDTHIIGAPLMVTEGYMGHVVLEVDQIALADVADAFRVEIYDAENNLVYVAASPNDPLVGDVGGLDVLGTTGDSKYVATVDLPPGSYTVLVRNNDSALTNLLDSNKDGSVDLTELGDKGVVLGPDNQDAVLDAVEEALSGTVLVNGIDTQLGSYVRGLLEAALDLTTVIGAGALVGVLTAPLNALGVTGLLDLVVGVVARELLSNTLTVFQKTELTTTLTEYGFAADTRAVSGNVLTADAGNAGDVADDLTAGSVVTQVMVGDDVTTVATTGTTKVQGLYGELTIAANGTYSYMAYGAHDSIGKTEVFFYTLADDTLSDTATLSITINGDGLPAVDAINDDRTMDLGDQQAVLYPSASNQEVQVLGVAEGTGAAANQVTVQVHDNWTGELRIEVRDVALVAVADAFVIEVLDQDGNIVFTALPQDNPLVGDVAGLGILGVTGDGALVATATGLPPGTYRVVVRKDDSALTTLLDTNGDGSVDLTELGTAGVVLGPDNQTAVLDAVENALNGNGLLDVLELGTSVRVILQIVLNVTAEIGAADLVGILGEGLNTLGLSDLLNDVTDAVADALLSNTLTLLQFTEVTTTLTEYAFTGATVINGNVIENGLENDREDVLATGGIVSKVQGADGVTVMVMDTNDGLDTHTTVYGQYGTLTIYESGAYTYQLNDRNGIGKSETFSYTITDGFTSDTADLVIQIDGDAAVDDAAVAGVKFRNPAPSIGDEFVRTFNTPGIGVLDPKETQTKTETIQPLVVDENKWSDVTITLTENGLLNGSAESYTIKVLDASNTELHEYTADPAPGSLTWKVPGGLSSGQYSIVVSSTNEPILGLAADAVETTVTVTQQVTTLNVYEVASVQTATGNILANDGIVAATYTLKVQDATDTFKDVMANGSTTITGEYGTLLMQADGSYTYTPFTTLTDPATPLSDTFSYQVVYGDRTETSTLTVHLQSSGTGTQSHEMADGTALELATMANSGIESITMQDGTGISSLNLTVADVNNLQITGADTLYVYGDAADKVTLTDAFQKTAIVTDTNGVVMTEYSSGTTKVLIDNDIVAVGGVII